LDLRNGNNKVFNRVLVDDVDKAKELLKTLN